MPGNVQDYTLSHTGSVVDSVNVTRSQNQIAPQLETQILEWECPDKFEEIRYIGVRDATRFVPRTKEEITGTTGDDTVVSLTSDIQPVAGETEIEDQDYPVCVAYNVTTSTQYDIVGVDYAANEVTLGTNPANGDTVKLWPIVGEGTIKMIGVNQFGQVEGPVQRWATPIYRFHDMEQNKRGTEVNLDGSISFQRNEKLRFVVDSPRQIQWTDPDYPNGGYVSTLEQDVEIEL